MLACPVRAAISRCSGAVTLQEVDGKRRLSGEGTPFAKLAGVASGGTVRCAVERASHSCAQHTVMHHRHATLRQGTARHGKLHRTTPHHITARLGTAHRSTARRARHSRAHHGTAWQARHGAGVHQTAVCSCCAGGKTPGWIMRACDEFIGAFRSTARPNYTCRPVATAVALSTLWHRMALRTNVRAHVSRVREALCCRRVRRRTHLRRIQARCLSRDVPKGVVHSGTRMQSGTKRIGRLNESQLALHTSAASAVAYPEHTLRRRQ